MPYKDPAKRRAAVQASKAKRRAQAPEQWKAERASEQWARRARQLSKVRDLLADWPTLYEYWDQLKYFERYPEVLPVGSNPHRVKKLLREHPLSAYPDKVVLAAGAMLNLGWVEDDDGDNFDDDYLAPNFKDEPGSGRPIINNLDVYPLFPDDYDETLDPQRRDR